MKILFLLLCIVQVPLFAQNLVPNPSFEERTGCPEGFPDLDGKLNDWMSFTGTPDYFHNCSEICGYNSNRGFQEPNSGEAYTGFVAYKTSLSNIREHLGIKLISPLIIGTRYYVSFFVSPAYRNSSQFNLATNKLGSLFTTYNFSFPNGYAPLSNNPQIYTNDIISDTANWVKINGSFIADSSYQYLIIGNFFEDHLLDTFEFPTVSASFESFYFLDDVCVSTDSLYTETWTTLSVNKFENNLITIYPNPTNNKVNIKSLNPIQSIELINQFGIVVLMKSLSEIETTLDIQGIDKGFYQLRIFSNSSFYVNKLVIN